MTFVTSGETPDPTQMCLKADSCRKLRCVICRIRTAAEAHRPFLSSFSLAVEASPCGLGTNNRQFLRCNPTMHFVCNQN